MNKQSLVLKMQEEFIEIEDGKVYLWSEIQEMGFDTDRFLKERIAGHVPIMDFMRFHERTHFVGVSFELVQSTKKFRAFRNFFSEEKVARKTKLRNLEYKIDAKEKVLWSWRFDGTDADKTVQLEEELVELKNELLERIKRVS